MPRRHLDRSAVRLASLWVALAAAPIAVGGLWPEGSWGLAGALSGLALLAATLLPVLAAACRSEDPLGVGVLLVAASLPMAALAFPFADVELSAVARALGYALVLLSLVLATGARRARRGPTVAWVASLCVGLPLLIGLFADLGATAPEGLRAAAPPLAISALLDGHSVLGPMLALGALGVLAGLVRWGGAGRRFALLMMMVCATASVWANPSVREVRELLGGYLRPGEPYPLTVELDDGLGTRVRATSLRHRWASEPGRVQRLAPYTVGSGRRIELEVGGGGEWSRDRVLEPRVLPSRSLLVGTLGRGEARLARELFPDPGARVALDPRDLSQLARSGEAVDVVVVEPGFAQEARRADHLRAWAAAGGVLVLGSAADMERVASTAGHEDLAATGSRRGVQLRPLGAGLLVGPGADGQLTLDAASRERLESRHAARARRVAIQEAGLALPRPGPSAALGSRMALGAGAVVLVLWLLGGLRARLDRKTFLGGAILVGVALAAFGVQVIGPRGRTYVRSAVILEAPAGARVARRLRILTCASPRSTRARLSLSGSATLRPVFDSTYAASSTSGTVTQGTQSTVLSVELRRTSRTYLRQDAIDLGGVVRLTRGAGGRRVRIENHTEHPLREAFAVVPGGLLRVGEIPPAGAVEIDLSEPPIPFHRWRLTALDGATRAWRDLVAATLAGRQLDQSLVLVSRTRARRQTRTGAAEEIAAPALLVVVASAETL